MYSVYSQKITKIYLAEIYKDVKSLLTSILLLPFSLIDLKSTSSLSISIVLILNGRP
jgi:hypothetical protein